MSADQNTSGSGVLLETMNWLEAEAVLNEAGVVVIPLGGAAKEHGPHLPLNNDALIANWLAREVAKRLPVVIAPLINTSFYPAFTNYPGSISLRAETARDLLVDTCHSMAAFGVARFYVLNTGVSTEGPLSLAGEIMRAEGHQFEYLKLCEAFSSLDTKIFEQEYGSHADEHETSLMLHIAPEVVDMSQAVDDGAEGEGKLSRVRGEGIWSASGVYGQATLASEGKGKLVAEAMVECAVRDILELITNHPLPRGRGQG